MMKTCIFLAEGFEEMEAIAIVDVLRRAGIETTTVSITDSLEVMSAHNVKIICDETFNNLEFSEYKMIIFPGGVKGVDNIKSFEPIYKIINYFYSSDRYVAAICAAPIILGNAGILENNSFTCYEGFEQFIKNGIYLKQKVVQDKNIITSNCAGSALEFGFKLVSVLKSEQESNVVEKQMVLG